MGDNDCIAHPANIPNKKIEINLPEKYFIVYPSASINVKCWPEERYAKIINKIYKKTKLPLVICGTNHDKIHVDKMLQNIDKDVNVINLINNTSVEEFIEVIGKSEFVITNDTSTYHIAVAKQVKTFILAGGYTYNTFCKYDYEKLGYKNPIIINKYMNCYNCNEKCIYKTVDIFKCLDEITIEDAWNIIDKNI